MKPLVTFDFDETLEYQEVQEFANEIINNYDINVGIFTSRFHYLQGLMFKHEQKDIISVAENLSIPERNIMWCGYRYKSEFLKPFVSTTYGNNFDLWLFHLDDNPDEVSKLLDMGMNAIHYSLFNDWKKECLLALNPLTPQKHADNTEPNTSSSSTTN